MKRIVHATFLYPAVLHHPTLGDTPVNVRWHREGDTVGISDRAEILLDMHELVFELSELEDAGITVTKGMTITITNEGTFQVMESMPENLGYQTWTASLV